MSLTIRIPHIVLLLASTLFSALVMAVVDGHKYPFEDPNDAERFQYLAENLRCPKCQNQNLADSNAPIAIDLRDKVYELLQDGKQDQEIVDHLVARYGDFVRYSPPMRLDTFLLWFGPAIIFLLGLLLIIAVRKNKKAALTPLTDSEQAQLDQLKAGVSHDSNKKPSEPK